MRCETTAAPQAFWERTSDFLLRDTVLNGVLVTTALDGEAVACSLYTDLANPTSNRTYAAIGYRPGRDVTMYRFTGGGA